jgi:phage gpG-like protein
MLHIEWDIGKATSAFDMLKLSTADKTELFQTVGAIMQRSIADQFITEGERYGNPWQPLQPATIARRMKRVVAAQKRAIGKWKRAVRGGSKELAPTFGGDVPILRDTGRLFSSIQILRTTPDFVDIGTVLVYAGTHQFGNIERNIPARPFLPDKMIPEDEDDINQAIEDWYQSKINEVDL